MTNNISFEDLRKIFPYLSMEKLFSMANALGIIITSSEMLLKGVRLGYIKRGRGAYKERIIFPTIKIDNKLISGSIIHPKIARETALALLNFCEQNNL